MAPKRRLDFPIDQPPIKLSKPSSSKAEEENVIIILDETHASDWLEIKLQSTQFLVTLLPQLDSFLQEFGYTIIDDPMVRSCLARITGKCLLSKSDRTTDFGKINLKAQRLISSDRTFVMHLSHSMGESYIQSMGEAYHNDVDVVYRYKSHLNKFSLMKPSTAIQLLRKDPQTLSSIPERFYEDSEFLSEAIATQIELLKTQDPTKNDIVIPSILLIQKKVLTKALELGFFKAVKRNIKYESLKDREVVITLLKFGCDVMFFSILELYSKDNEILKICNEKFPYYIINNEQYLDLVKSPTSFKYLDHETRNDKEFILKIVEKCQIYNYLSSDLQKDRNIALKAVRGNANYFKYLPRELRCDKEIACIAISNDPDMYYYVSENLKEDHNIIQIFKKKFHKLPQFNINLRHLPPDFRKDKEIVLKSVSTTGEMILLASEELLNDREVLLAACNRFTYHYEKKDFRIPYFIPESFRKDVSFMLEISKQNPICYELVHEELRNDKTFLLEFFKVIENFLKMALTTYDSDSDDDDDDRENVEKLIIQKVFALIPYKFLNDRNFLLESLEINATLINFFPYEWGNDIEVAMLVLKQNPEYYKNLSKQFRENKDIVMLALAYPNMDIPTEFISDKDIVMKAIEYNASKAFKEAHKELQKDRDVILHYLTHNTSTNAFYYYYYDKTINDVFLQNLALRNDREVMLDLLSHGMMYFKYIDEKLKKDPEFAFQLIEKKCNVDVRGISKLSKQVQLMKAKSIDSFIEHYLKDEDDSNYSSVKKQVLGPLIKLFNNDQRVIQSLKVHQNLFKNDKEFTLQFCLYEGFVSCLGNTFVNDVEFMKRATLLNFNNVIYSKDFLMECWTSYLNEKLNYKRMRKCFNYLSSHSFDTTGWNEDPRTQQINTYLDSNILKGCNCVTTEARSAISKFLLGFPIREEKFLIHEEITDGHKVQIYFHMDPSNRKWKKIMQKQSL